MLQMTIKIMGTMEIRFIWASLAAWIPQDKCQIIFIARPILKETMKNLEFPK